MKYTNYFRSLMFIALIFTGSAVTAYFERTLPLVCAICTVFGFIFWYAGVMAPDSEKYSDEYKKRKGL